MKKITDVYKKEFFKSIGKAIMEARSECGLTFDDLVEMTGFSEAKLQSIENGNEKRLLKLQFESLLNLCNALNKKITIHLETFTEKEKVQAELPAVSDEELLMLIASRIK